MRPSHRLGLVLLLAALSGATAAPRAQESTAWTEHLLATIPSELSPNVREWDSWISVTPDLSSVAYAARFRAGDVMREAIVFRDQRERPYTFASRPVISPDGRHLAYITVDESNGGFPGFLVLDGARVQTQYLDRELSAQWIPVFSPDSSKIAFVAERPGRRRAIGVADVAAAVGDVLPVAWGPEFDAVDQPRWFHDSSVVVYAAGRSRNEWVVMKGTTIVASAADITDVAVAPDGAIAFWASDGFVVTTRGRSERYDGVLWNPRINDDGTMVAYAALQGRELWWKVARLP